MATPFPNLSTFQHTKEADVVKLAVLQHQLSILRERSKACRVEIHKTTEVLLPLLREREKGQVRFHVEPEDQEQYGKFVGFKIVNGPKKREFSQKVAMEKAKEIFPDLVKIIQSEAFAMKAENDETKIDNLAMTFIKKLWELREDHEETFLIKPIELPKPKKPAKKRKHNNDDDDDGHEEPLDEQD
jgi:hypothetical protein